MNIKGIKRFSVMLLSTMVIAGCGNLTQTSSSNSNTSEDTIKIGGNFELTGSAAGYGY